MTKPQLLTILDTTTSKVNDKQVVSVSSRHLEMGFALRGQDFSSWLTRLHLKGMAYTKNEGVIYFQPK